MCLPEVINKNITTWQELRPQRLHTQIRLCLPSLPSDPQDCAESKQEALRKKWTEDSQTSKMLKVFLHCVSTHHQIPFTKSSVKLFSSPTMQVYAASSAREQLLIVRKRLFPTLSKMYLKKGGKKLILFFLLFFVYKNEALLHISYN